MKKLILLLLIIVSVPIFAETYTNNDNITDYTFQLKLLKTGTNVIWFSKDKEGKVAVPDNRHIFPLVQESTAPFDSEIYFHWNLDDTKSSKVSLSFVSSEVDYQNAKYMLENMSPNVNAVDMNYDVTLVNVDTGASVEKIIKNSAEGGVGTLLTERSLDEMTITLEPSATETARHFKITMTICPAFSVNGGDLQFMEAQYAGYIVAELKYN